MTETYETHAKGIRIVPGQWRPHYPFEQIAWISPPWPCQEYVWLDFPEAIFTDAGLLYLSHVNPAHPVVFENLPKVPWRSEGADLAFDRTLPNGIAFGGSIRPARASAVDLELYLRNGSGRPLGNITLQTCAYLRGIKEFADFTDGNKFLMDATGKWVSLASPESRSGDTGRFRVGWRNGPKAASLPLLVTLSNQAPRLVAMTWFEDTYSLIGNAGHPCMHADPFFPDLPRGQSHTIRGQLIFFEGSLEAFGELVRRRAIPSGG